MSPKSPESRFGGAAILFVSFHHAMRDPRLFYRQVFMLRRAMPNARILALTNRGCRPYPQVDASANWEEESRVWPAQWAGESALILGSRFITRVANWALRPLLRLRQLVEVTRLGPRVIQASDVRELPFAVIASRLTGARLVYDSHEDYFNQVYEYRGKTVLAVLIASWVRFLEWALVRCADVVFCTDDFLFAMYSKRGLAARDVRLLRNFPPTAHMPGMSHVNRIASVSRVDPLKLVYIGSVNALRGVLETAEYVRRFNTEERSQRLEFTVFASDNAITRRLSSIDGVRVRGTLPYTEIMAQLRSFDVGVCLWLQTAKFARNLPIKNFDYMAAGLPILTSNFGNLERYARDSGGAICIDPASYEDFRAAILRLGEPMVRAELGKSGRRYVCQSANFECESVSYVQWYRAAAEVVDRE